MKKIFICYIIILLSACGEKADEKKFLDKNVRAFIEYNEIAGVTPKINLYNMLTKMVEVKFHIQDYDFSNDCQRNSEYLLNYMTQIIDGYKNFSLDDGDATNLLYIRIAETLINETLKYNSCNALMKVLDKRKYIEEQNSLLITEVSKTIPNINLVSQYISNGADINKRDENDNTVLMIAAKHNKTSEVIKLLIKSGADVNARNYSYDTALTIASHYNNNPEIIKLLNKKDNKTIKIEMNKIDTTKVVVDFLDETWFELKDKNRVYFNGLYKKGDRQEVDYVENLFISVGRPENVKIYVKGKEKDLLIKKRKTNIAVDTL